MTDLNVELFDETLQHVIDYPEEHDQGVWRKVSSCGTTACFAGRALILAGVRWYDNDRWVEADADDDHRYCVYMYVPGEGEVRVCSTRAKAQRLLGLTEGQAAKLFLCTVDHDEAVRVAKEIRDGVDFVYQPGGGLVRVEPPR